MLELMVAVAIVAIIAGLALPNIVDIVRGYRAREKAADVLAAFNEARNRSQSRNAPTLLLLQGNQLAVLDSTPVGGTLLTDLVQIVDSGAWVNFRQFSAAGVTFDAPTATALTAGIYFCPSSRATYREDTIDGTALCPLGDLASQSLDTEFSVLAPEHRFKIELWAAVGNARLVGGAG